MTLRECAHLEVREQPCAGGVRREACLSIDGREQRYAWHYDIWGRSGPLGALDGMIHSCLFLAMRMGLPLRVHGAVTETALYNLAEFTRAWSHWRPDLYHAFDILPEQVIAPTSRVPTRAIAAFSGGVDGTFTLLHNRSRLAAGGHDIQSALLIHGFDVDYENELSFNRLIERLRPNLESLGAELQIIRTNSKHLPQDWEDSFGAQLAGCLHQYSDRYGTALIASSEPYSALILPLGSNPLTDRLLSGGLMQIVHDGAQFSRTEKVVHLAKHPALIDRLKVCWEGAVQHENCGTCEKCTRTRLNFLAAGVSSPGCFDSPFDAATIDRLRIRNAFQLAELKNLLAYAEDHDVAAEWVARLRRRLSWLDLRCRGLRLLDALHLRAPVRRLARHADRLLRRNRLPPDWRQATVPPPVSPRSAVPVANAPISLP